ncbi:MAG: c-type cytochrome [Granulosicoccaceae bacterium]
MKILMNTVAALTLLVAAPAWAGGDASAGEGKAQTCAACHGPGGNSTIPINPKLAGQYESYLAYALTSYKDGTRKNPIMGAQVAALSEQDIADLAAYFAAQPGQMAVVPKN